MAYETIDLIAADRSERGRGEVQGGAMQDTSGGGVIVDAPVRDAPPATSTVTATFTRHSVGKVCTLVRSACVRANIAPRDVEDLLIAVSEIVTNAIRYAGGGGSVTLQRLSGGLLTEICDEGPGLPDHVLPGRRALDFPADGRGGLWLARLLCRDFAVLSSPRGVTVRMFTPCRAPT
jgi:serine/threonine-protein kinase RsbW